MGSRRLIVIGASAGGVEALTRLVHDFPADLPASVFIVVHIPCDATSVLPQILARSGPLKAAHARNGDSITDSRIYVAPPDYHLLVENDNIATVHAPRENGHRPAVDPLFRSAAQAHGKNVIGVILTGNLDDGTAGLRAIKSSGGIAIVQDPDEAMHPGMPRSAVTNVAVDYVLPLREMAPTILRLLLEDVAIRNAGPPGRAADVAENDVQTVKRSIGSFPKSGPVSALAAGLAVVRPW